MSESNGGRRSPRKLSAEQKWEMFLQVTTKVSRSPLLSSLLGRASFSRRELRWRRRPDAVVVRAARGAERAVVKARLR